MNDQTETKKGGGLKFLLFLSLAAFVAIGGYAVYKLVVQKPSVENIVSTIPTPTTAILKDPIAISPTMTPFPTDKISMAILTPTLIPTIKTSLPTNTPTSIPTKIPTPSVRVSPTTTIIPTVTLLPTATVAVTRATIQPTQKPVEKLPDSGVSFPTIFLLSFGLIFMLPLILLR